jgi:GNAT superfamily N-acetyltransferase
MGEIIKDLSAAAMLDAIDGNLSEFYRLFRFWPRAEVHEDPELQWTLTDIPFSLFNSAVGAQLTPDNLDTTIEAVKSRCRKKNVPVLWWVGPNTRPADLGTHLERHDFIHDGDDAGMAANLMNLNESLAVPPGLVIEKVSDMQTLKLMCHVCAAGFEAPELFEQAIFDFFASLGFDTEAPVYNYLGRLKGEPVATSTLFLGTGVAGIYDVSTIPAARRQGVGAALTLYPLLEARRQGYRVGILQASTMGASVYRRVGFQEYCQIGEYVWAGEK